VMVMSMTALAHLITLLSTNDSKLTMCWHLAPTSTREMATKQLKSEVSTTKVLTFSLRPEDWANAQVLSGGRIHGGCIQCVGEKNLNMIVVGT